MGLKVMLLLLQEPCAWHCLCQGLKRLICGPGYPLSIYRSSPVSTHQPQHVLHTCCCCRHNALSAVSAKGRSSRSTALGTPRACPGHFQRAHQPRRVLQGSPAGQGCGVAPSQQQPCPPDEALLPHCGVLCSAKPLQTEGEYIPLLLQGCIHFCISVTGNFSLAACCVTRLKAPTRLALSRWTQPPRLLKVGHEQVKVPASHLLCAITN